MSAARHCIDYLGILLVDTCDCYLLHCFQSCEINNKCNLYRMREPEGGPLYRMEAEPEPEEPEPEAEPEAEPSPSRSLLPPGPAAGPQCWCS